MPNFRHLSVLACLIAFAASLPGATPGVELSLISDGAAPAKPFRVGVLIHHLPGFHTYYRAPGIVGLPTTIAWELPPGFTAGELQWPAPEETKMFDYKAYGYESDTLLFATITPPPNAPPTFTIGAKVTFMACSTTCHPGAATLTLPFPDTGARPDAFARATALIPPNAGTEATARLEESALVLTLPGPAGGLVFVPDGNHYDPNSPQRAEGSELRVPVLRDMPVPSGARAVSGLLGSFQSGTFSHITVPLDPSNS